MKLSGWTCLGIVLSVLWMLLISGIALCELSGWAPLGKIVIMQPAVLTGGFVDDLGIVEKPSLNVYRLVKALLVPLLIGWIAVYLIVKSTRWVYKGFKRQ
jgi:hypothetical protein